MPTYSVAFESWMGTQHETDHIRSRGIFPTVSTKEGQDPATVRQLELDVAETAGAAARAVEVAGGYITVAGLGAVNPVVEWLFMSAPKAIIAPRDVRMTAATVRGRLLTMISEAETALDSGAPAFAPSQLHPLIWTAAAAHWTTHQYRVAVREAAEALTVEWKTRLGRNDVDDTVFWQQTLSAGA